MLADQKSRCLVIKHLAYFLSATALLAFSVGPAPAQNASELASLIASGQQQLQVARTSKTEAGYRQAETTFDRAVQLGAKSATARLYRGLARLELSGWLASQGQFGPSGDALNGASGDLDAAVAMVPNDAGITSRNRVVYSSAGRHGVRRRPYASATSEAVTRFPTAHGHAAGGASRITRYLSYALYSPHVLYSLLDV